MPCQELAFALKVLKHKHKGGFYHLLCIEVVHMAVTIFPTQVSSYYSTERQVLPTIFNTNLVPVTAF